MDFLLLGIDSLIAGLAIGPVVGRRALLPLAVLFGVADGVGFLLGAVVGWQISEGISEGVQTGILVALGVYLIGIAVLSRRAAARGRWSASRWPSWVLPFVLSLDNLTYGLIKGHTGGWLFGQAGQQVLASALLALVGLAVGVVLPRLIPAMGRRTAATGVAGGALVVAAGALLLTG